MKSGQADLFSQAGGDVGLLPKPANQLQTQDWPASLDGLSEPWRDILINFWGSAIGQSLDLKISQAQWCISMSTLLSPLLLRANSFR